MCDNVKSNPFAGLFSSVNDAVSFSSQQQTTDDDGSNTDRTESTERNTSNPKADKSRDETEPQVLDAKVHKLLREVFGITLCANSAARYPLVFIDTDSLEQAVFERLLLPNPAAKMVYDQSNCDAPIDSHVLQRQVIPYLYKCYCHLKHDLEKKSTDSLEVKLTEEACQIVLRNVSTAVQEPELFQNQKIYTQFANLFMDDDTSKLELPSFVSGVMEHIVTSNENCEIESVVITILNPIFNIVRQKTALCNLFTFRHHWCLLHAFSSIELSAKLILYHSAPKSDPGRVYANSLLGTFLSISCLPKNAEEKYDLFNKPLQQSNTTMESSIWTAMDNLSEQLHKVFHSLLKCSTETRHLTLQWIGNCLHANANRGKLWNLQTDMGFGAVLCVPDGFMLNLGNILLRLCQPFCIKLDDNKVPNIDPTYCAAEAKSEDEALQRGIHITGLNSETCLIPTPEGENRPIASSFGFTTECFFFTHRTLDLGYRVILDKFLRTNEDLARIQRVYNDARTGGSSEVAELVFQRMDTEMSKYLSLKASLLAPEMLQHLTRFYAVTAFWLVQVNLHVVTNKQNEQDFIPKQYIRVTFPLPEVIPTTLRCIPEFVVENTIGFLCFLRRLSPNTFEEHGPKFMNPILTMIIVLMETQSRLYNPHLRARLAEGLEALLPTPDEIVDPMRTPNLGTFHREQLFLTHPHRQQIIANLLQVFVSIEMTGQSVQFEQKFNYRRPMYVVMNYLWKLPEHRQNFITLAEEAEKNMEAVQPPLFLRFINLLMNDAVFLLDESLSNMAQLRQMLQARQSGEWNNLSPHEREQQTANFEHIGMIARFDNILGTKTIQMIKMLTTEIKSIFCHPTMVERIASMLNYLLLQLVGPNKNNFKVNDHKEYSFIPAILVLNICEIYINLAKSESFTLAVSQDGRSYSPELFKLADTVLVRIGGAGILGDLDQFAKSVERAANQKRQEDEILTGVPDEFLDPIMSTIMTDPVILPSSRVNVDRQTIARHLLSDQTDPFNRSPLTMDVVKPNVELQQKIRDWISQKKKEKASNT